MTKSKAYYQAYLVIQCLSKEEYSLIPKALLDEITSKMEVDDTIKVDSTVPLEKQKIDEKAYDILDKVIRAIEREYGKDAIDNPGKYAKDVKDDSNKKSPNVETKGVTVASPSKKADEKTPNKSHNIPSHHDETRDNTKMQALQNENIKLQGIIKALEEENKKIDKAKDLVIEYKEFLAAKDEQIRELNIKLAAAREEKEEIYSMYQRIPAFLRKIFAGDDKKMLKGGEKVKK